MPYPTHTNTTRPEAEAVFSVRGPKILKQLVRNAATLRQCSETEVILSALENELGRMMVYGEDFYVMWALRIAQQQARRFPHASVVRHQGGISQARDV